jgi:hypothetical protein
VEALLKRGDKRHQSDSGSRHADACQTSYVHQ